MGKYTFSSGELTTGGELDRSPTKITGTPPNGWALPLALRRMLLMVSTMFGSTIETLIHDQAFHILENKSDLGTVGVILGGIDETRRQPKERVNGCRPGCWRLPPPSGDNRT